MSIRRVTEDTVDLLEHTGMDCGCRFKIWLVKHPGPNIEKFTEYDLFSNISH